MQLEKNKKRIAGFTLIELLVSIALFSIVLTVTLGSIMTIADSNKKARSLMSVTNNLNFAIDSMVRSFKSGEIDVNPVFDFSGGDNNCFSTKEIDYGTNSEFANTRRPVEYCWIEDNGVGDAKKGKIVKIVNGDTIDLTSPDVDVDYLRFEAPTPVQGSIQPMLSIMIEGKVKISEKVSSQFSIQTSVSQRRLNI